MRTSGVAIPTAGSGKSGRWLSRTRTQQFGWNRSHQGDTSLRPGHSIRGPSLSKLCRMSSEHCNSTPAQVVALVTRGHILQSINRLEDAIADLKQAIAASGGAVPTDTANWTIGQSGREYIPVKPLPLQGAPDLAKRMLEWLEASASLRIAGQCTDEIGSGRPKPLLEVSVAGGANRVGEPIVLTWSVAEFEPDAERPAYLVVTTPDPSRFNGRGF